MSESKFVINRLREYSGKARNQVRNPCITARESIMIADHIVQIESNLTAAQAENEGLRVLMSDLVAWADQYVGARLMYDEVEAARSHCLDAGPRDLRKQAEAVEEVTQACQIKSATDDSKCYLSALMSYASSLRQRAEALERQSEGGVENV